MRAIGQKWLWRALAFGAAIGFAAWAHHYDSRQADHDLAPYRAAAAFEPPIVHTEIETFALLIRSGLLVSDPKAANTAAWPGASPQDVARLMTTSGWSLVAVTAALGDRREPLPFSGVTHKAMRLVTALSMYGRHLAETNHPRDAAAAFKAALVVSASIRASGTVIGVLAGSAYASSVLAAIDELRPRLDADVLRGFRGFAWPGADAALQATRAGYARHMLEWVDGRRDGEDELPMPSLLRKWSAISQLARFEADMDVVDAAIKANASPEACEASVENIEAQALCKKLPSLRVDEAIARFERSL